MELSDIIRVKIQAFSIPYTKENKELHIIANLTGKCWNFSVNSAVSMIGLPKLSIRKKE